MSKIIIKNGQVINEGQIIETDILIENQKIVKIDADITDENATVIDASDKWIVPGVIDDQVHFREPGLTHKANIASESAAAVAGGITSFMEMPNTVPNALTQELLEDKYQIAANSSVANYSFFMGASNDNLDEVLKTNKSNVCGIKIFMGSSTGNMLVDDQKTLEGIFSEAELLIATHCEDEATIRKNTAIYKEKYGEEMPFRYHPEIRSREACYLSSSTAVALAKKTGARLHVLHISTAEETQLFEPGRDFSKKRITAEACTHHLWFTEDLYDEKGAMIKWNPAVKKQSDQDAIWQALLDNRIDVMATDHAPHTIEEKQNNYFSAPSGGPLVQHALVAALQMADKRSIDWTRIIDKMCHAPADLFEVKERGYIKEGYYADLVLVKKSLWKVTKENLLYKCQWSPFEGTTFDYAIDTTIVNGNVVYQNGKVDRLHRGMRLAFDR